MPLRSILSESFGPLEVQVLEAVWAEAAPATVRSIRDAFPRLAYTTLMTTLDRLHRKGVLDRVKAGRAFAYTARLTRHETELRLASESIAGILGGHTPASMAPLLSCFVDAVSDRDRKLLDDLEKVVRAKRAALRGEGRS
ncbi:MAG TPA: BlaI/MecI/CopY family transcriptional regulator [Candidatus Polarisedimenticolaceae bacterium]|nr:BlaI/MecI/CopY family transcriptional regulator [Candidatus Polarisedimenticolaceae bacterium]